MQVKGQKDSAILVIARGIRGFAYGFMSLFVQYYLVNLGYSALSIGIFLSISVTNTIVTSLIVGLWGDKLGRKKTITILATLILASSILFASTKSIYVIAISFVLGGVAITGGGSGAFTSLEQSSLRSLAAGKGNISKIFSIYNAVGFLISAIGSLFFGISSFIPQALARLIFFTVYATIAGALVILYLNLSGRIEFTNVEVLEGARIEQHRDAKESVSLIKKLTLLNSLDSFAGGFVIQSFLALWFEVRFHTSAGQISMIFFLAGLFAAFSFFAAARLANRIGMIRTAVFTHLPSDFLLIFLGLAPNLSIALVIFFARMSTSLMDIPVKQAYTVSIVHPRHVTAAVSMTNVSRNITQSISPSIAGYLLQGSISAVPFIISGPLYAISDLLTFYYFRNVKE